jgi:signal transduction histidine kinase
MEVASASIAQTKAIKPNILSRKLVPHFGVRARQTMLLTLMVMVIVLVIIIANIANLTSFVINRTETEASQLSRQIIIALQQDLLTTASEENEENRAPLNTIAEHSNSRARNLMDSGLITIPAIAYLYVTDKDGQIVTDPKGKAPMAINMQILQGQGEHPPDLSVFAKSNGYLQLFRLLGNRPLYELHSEIKWEDETIGNLYIGVSAATIFKELFAPLKINLLIGLISVIGAAIVASISANVLLRPLEVISSSIEQLETQNSRDVLSEYEMPQDEMVTGVTARLKQLGARLADERSELEIMRGRLRQVISHLEDRLLLINREGRVILASPDSEQLLGLHTEISGLPIDETLGMNHPLVVLVERAFNERRSIARTTLRSTGRLKGRQVLASVQYIEDAGVPVGALVGLRDYESYQKFESQWDLSKKLADLGRITSGIAHEVKNPLNSMVIHLEILRSKMESGTADPEPQLEILDSEIRRLDRVVQTFLNFTRPVEVRMEPLDLNTIVNQVVALASMEAAERGVTIKKELLPGQLIVKGDADMLKQALLNVILNGCQAMPEGGILIVSTAVNEEDQARIIVSDSGIGIPDEARERIFNLYYTTKQGGTGIGLAQAFRAMQLHNGNIGFESKVGIGTTFEITLPTLR